MAKKSFPERFPRSWTDRFLSLFTESQESNTNLFKFENELLFIICWRTLSVSEWQSIMERLVSTWAVDKRQSKSSDGIWNSSQLRIFSVFSLFKAKSGLNLFWLFPRQIVVWRQESRFKYFKFGHNSTKREASTSNNLLARRFSLQMEMPRNFKRGSMPSSKVNRTFDDSVLTFIQSFHYIEIMYLLLISFCCCRQHINRPSQWPTQNWQICGFIGESSSSNYPNTIVVVASRSSWLRSWSRLFPLFLICEWHVLWILFVATFGWRHQYRFPAYRLSGQQERDVLNWN